MKKIIVIMILSFYSVFAFSQELNCRVSINHSNVQNTSNQQIFQSLQRDISEFMNTTKWTDYSFKQNERIDCNISIIVNKFNGMDRFEATLQITSSRPVYGTSLKSPLLNYKEKDNLFTFRYVENQAIEFNESSYSTNLAYVMAFYAYIAIGYDFDSYSLFGGEEFFQIAQKLVTNAQSSPERGWKAFESTDQNNRYYLAKDLISPIYKPMREASYKYHRLGMDVMTENITGGRKQVGEAIKLLVKVHKKKTDSFLMRVFLDAKRKEIINIYSEAPNVETKPVVANLKMIDVGNSEKYDKMGGK